MDDYRMQRVTGLLLLVLGVGTAIAVWTTPTLAEPLIRKIAAALSACAVVGAAMLILPSPRAERAGRGEDLWDMSGLKMITARWWLAIVVALAVGSGHFALVGNETSMSFLSAQASKN